MVLCVIILPFAYMYKKYSIDLTIKHNINYIACE